MSELIDNKKLHDIKNDNIESILMKLNEKYANLWNGAIQSKFSDNPDKIRHYCISIRELFTHIINDLAPDDKIKEWTQDPKLYNNNAPTKKARILYIFRELNNDQFLSSIEENINFFLNIIEILNKGTHELFSSFNDEKIVFIEIKIEYLLRIIANLEFIKYKVKS